MKKFLVILTLLSSLLISCGKDFLEIKQTKNMVIPKTIADLQAILDNDFRNYSAHNLAINGSDEYYMEQPLWNRLLNTYYEYIKDTYTWSKDLYFPQYESAPDWHKSYYYIFYANLALDGINTIPPKQEEQKAWNQVKGSALFFRALRYYHLAQQYAFPYNKDKDDKYGLPLRLEADVTMMTNRSTVHQTYNQLLQDALDAVELLTTEHNKLNHIRPHKAAAFALVAKIYLSMEDYANAYKYAEECLKLESELVDYNNLDLANPAKRFDYTFIDDFGVTNPEMLYYSHASESAYDMLPYFETTGSLFYDTALQSLFSPHDLRPLSYFRPYFDLPGYDHITVFKGSYGTYRIFTGIATDEIYLIRAESAARLNKTNEALSDLNTLLINRIDKNYFSPVTEKDPEKLLKIILEERRKELFLRGTRWEDLRRLNKDPRFATTLVREIDGRRFELPPNDARYTWPLPQSEIDAGGLEQNPR